MTRVRFSFVSALFILVIAGQSLTAFGGLPSEYFLSVALTALLAFSIYANASDIGPSALLFFFLYVGSSHVFPSFIWSLPAGVFIASIFVTYICLLRTPWLKPSLTWIRRGSLSQVTLALVAITSLVSVAALGLWALWADYLGVGSAMMRSLRTTPAWMVLGVYIPAFALVNAFAEEAIYRGFLLDALRKRFPNRMKMALCLQASAFAAAHYRSGFPNGKVGYLMTFTYALMLGHLRERSEGMLAPFIAHVVADLMIGALLFFLTA